MKKIYAKAIEMADSVSLKEKLIAVVAKIDKSDYAERFIDILFDADIKEDELAHVVERYDEIRTRTDFDYLNDRVNYDYTRTTARYFTSEEDAAEYSKSGNYDYSKSKSSLQDGYTYEGIYVRNSESYCTLYEWMDSKVVEK